MTLQALLGLLGLVVALALVFPRPPRKPKGDPRFYSVPPTLFWPVVVLNQLDRALHDFAGVRLIKPNTDEIIALAQSVPKSDLFGPQDPVVDGIRRFQTCFAASSPTAFGIFANNRYKRINLEKRKQVMEYIVRNPSIADIPIRRPVIITGMPRTGSTLLYNLLHQDPRTRSPHLWEMAGANPNPTPPPTGPTGDPRAEAVKRAIDLYNTFLPTLLSESAKSHFTGAYEIEECLFILVHQFVHQVLTPVTGPEYVDWLLDDTNKEYAYVYLKRYLQMLSSGYAPASHWSLKAPVHGLYVATLLKVFPDALVVVTHRDPLEVVPSTAKLCEVSTFFHYEANTLDRRWVGDLALNACGVACDRIMAYRERHGSGSFVDVRYADLVADPLRVVREIYARAGHEVTGVFEANARKYLADNRQGKHGRNTYDLESFGLSEARINERFAKYRQTYNV